MSDPRAVTPDIEVTLRLHAQLREIVGDDSMPLRVPADSTVAEVFDHASTIHPGLASFRDVIAFACNDRLVTASVTLTFGDQLDLLPPVSGG